MRHLLAIAAGVISACLLFAFFTLFGYVLLSVSETWYGYTIIIFIYLIITVTAGYITSIICEKKEILNAGITGLGLILLLLINNDFRFDSTIEEWLVLYCILLLAILGGLLGKKRKNKEITKNKNSSLPGTDGQ